MNGFRRWKGLSLTLVVVLAAVGVIIGRLQVAAAATEDVSLFNPAKYMARVQAATKGVSGLDYKKAQGVLYHGTRLIRVPGATYGGAAVALDAQGNVSSVLVTQNTVDEQTGLAHSAVFLNNQQLGDLSLDLKTGVVTEGWMLQSGKRVSYAGFDATASGDVHADVTWYCFRNCLVNIMGVPSWVLGLVGAVCSAACLITVGTGCVLCVQGVLIAYGSEVTFCLGYCRSA